MSKLTTIYNCSKCGAQSPKWSGRCLECGAWGTYQEDVVDQGQQRDTPNAPAAKVTDFANISSQQSARIKTNISECDRVLGGGIVPGSLILIGGEPGIGKSTIALQIAHSIANTLYVSGEESAQQIKSRMERLGINNNITFVSETNVEKVIATIIKNKPNLVIIDSIQTIYSSDVDAEAGAINQIRVCTIKLLQVAKTHNIAIIITGHITKDGLLAGPKTLEHLVDTVIYLEQQKNNDFRIMRSVKNRFGSTDEIGLFEMTQNGFKEINNPSGIFLDEIQNYSGTAVSAIMEGTRPFFVEVQALVTKTVFGYPQRKTNGIDINRLQILIAVLTKRAGINLSNQDIHINVVGGLKINETSLDLALCAAIVSSLNDKVIDKKTIILGEVGLGGEVRKIHKLEQRLQEAKKLGFTTAVMPETSTTSNLSLIKIKNVSELVQYINQ